MHKDELQQSLDHLQHAIWTTAMNAADLNSLREKATQCIREFEILAVLSDTREWLELDSEKKNFRRRCTEHQNRIRKMIEEVHSDKTDPKARSMRLYSSDLATFLFVSASYTPQGINRLEERLFETLLNTVPKYLATTPLPANWMHRREFQIAIAAGASNGSKFKRKYQELEYEEPAKRPRKGSSVSQDQQSIFSLQQCNDASANCSNKETSSDTGISTSVEMGWNESLGIETAFEVTREAVEKMWDKGILPSEGIMTVPYEDRVSSLCFSIPRHDAIRAGEEYKLRTLPPPMSG